MAPKKVATSIRLSPDVVASFTAKGRGWQASIDAELKKIAAKRERDAMKTAKGKQAA